MNVFLHDCYLITSAYAAGFREIVRPLPAAVMWLHEMKAQICSLFRRFLQVRSPLSPGKKRGFTAHFGPDGAGRRLAFCFLQS